MRRAILLSTSFLAGFASLAQPAVAQTTLADSPKSSPTTNAVAPPAASGSASTPAAAPAPGRSGEVPAADIIVTGSRVTRNGYQAPTPVTVFGPMKDLG